MSNAGDGDKRTVTTDALETLGTIIGPNEKRDAIHLAVEPVEAGEDLAPGQRIAVKDGIATAAWQETGEPPLGIVDPFLSSGPDKGQRFWFIMNPRQVRSLRHVWTHPAFPDEDAAGVARGYTKATSEQWLRNFCDTHDCPRYDRMIPLLMGKREQDEQEDGYETRARIDGDLLTFYGTDAHGDIPPEFWDHVEVVTGVKFPSRPIYFNCSC